MRLTLSLSAAALVAGLGCAAAQQGQAAPPSQGDPGQQQRHDQMLQTVPGKNGKEEPSSHAPTATDTAVFVDGKLNVPGAPQDGQTVPANFPHNHDLDVLPTMANHQPDRRAGTASPRRRQSNVPIGRSMPNRRLLPVTTRAELPKEVAGFGHQISRSSAPDRIMLVRATACYEDEFTY